MMRTITRPDLDAWRDRQLRRAARRDRRDYWRTAGLYVALGFLTAWLTLGCATPSCPYDALCAERGPDYTDMGVGCIDDCLAPNTEN